MDLKKQAFIEAYKKTFGNISMSAELAKIDRQTYYNWLEKDAEFKAAIEALKPDEIFLDFCENALQKKIGKGDTTAIIFALKTKGKNRGYVERQEVTGKDGEDLFKDVQIKIVNGNTGD
jgi:hypothetical protein